MTVPKLHENVFISLNTPKIRPPTLYHANDSRRNIFQQVTGVILGQNCVCFEEKCPFYICWMLPSISKITPKYQRNFKDIFCNTKFFLETIFTTHVIFYIYSRNPRELLREHYTKEYSWRIWPIPAILSIFFRALH